MARMRKVIAAVMSVLCLLFYTYPVIAADERIGNIVDGSLLTDDTKAEGFVQPLKRGAFLSGGTGGVLIVGGRTLQVSGDTSCYRKVDTVKVTLHLQRLVGNTWEHVATLGPKSASNTSYVSASNTYTVSGGYYYRVYGAHTAIDDGAVESGTSYSNGIWVY